MPLFAERRVAVGLAMTSDGERLLDGTCTEVTLRQRVARTTLATVGHLGLRLLARVTGVLLPGPADMSFGRLFWESTACAAGAVGTAFLLYPSLPFAWLASCMPILVCARQVTLLFAGRGTRELRDEFNNVVGLLLWPLVFASAGSAGVMSIVGAYEGPPRLAGHVSAYSAAEMAHRGFAVKFASGIVPASMTGQAVTFWKDGEVYVHDVDLKRHWTMDGQNLCLGTSMPCMTVSAGSGEVRGPDGGYAGYVTWVGPGAAASGWSAYDVLSEAGISASK